MRKEDAVRRYFEDSKVVSDYERATRDLGLWLSEERICSRVFKKEDAILDLGCGSGRIAFGLYDLGYRNLIGVDFSEEMVTAARRIGSKLGCPIPFRKGDATALEFEDELFEGVIFGFNGLMQIPKAAQRFKAMCECARIITQGGFFVFTTHDRDRSPHSRYWTEEAARWTRGEQSEEKEIFGDRLEHFECGMHFMHVPSREEVEELVEKSGLRVEATTMRSELVTEPYSIQKFSDNCRFWITQKVAPTPNSD